MQPTEAASTTLALCLQATGDQRRAFAPRLRDDGGVRLVWIGGPLTDGDVVEIDIHPNGNGRVVIFGAAFRAVDFKRRARA